MSLLGWFLKPKKQMAKKGTKHVKIGKYTISSHAQNRVAQPEKNLKKSDMARNLLGKSYTTKPYMYKGEQQYDKIHNKTKTVTHVTLNNKVKTIHKVHKPNKEIEKDLRRKR